MKLPFTTEASPSLNTDGGVKFSTNLVVALTNLVSEPNWTLFNEVVSEVFSMRGRFVSMYENRSSKFLAGIETYRTREM